MQPTSLLFHSLASEGASYTVCPYMYLSVLLHTTTANRLYTACVHHTTQITGTYSCTLYMHRWVYIISFTCVLFKVCKTIFRPSINHGNIHSVHTCPSMSKRWLFIGWLRIDFTSSVMIMSRSMLACMKWPSWFLLTVPLMPIRQCSWSVGRNKVSLNSLFRYNYQPH